MSLKIPLLQDETILDLGKGKYKIYALGGHDIELKPSFNIEIININDSEHIVMKETTRIRGHKNKKKSIRIYSFRIEKNGSYIFKINNPESLILKNSILNGIVSKGDRIYNSQIELLIE